MPQGAALLQQTSQWGLAPLPGRHQLLLRATVLVHRRGHLTSQM